MEERLDPVNDDDAGGRSCFPCLSLKVNVECDIILVVITMITVAHYQRDGDDELSDLKVVEVVHVRDVRHTYDEDNYLEDVVPKTTSP